ncbi:cobalamin-binding protein [Metabacillus sp. GX 13764]|uniref:cobalamin-binding protein n=1 Tax=Metabacillus kandeliae TaxID=2900151 RepID=UPI001E54941E|nr:cobalamin-binding protein [Metabacillus kandeliae]MCD7036232.1 cobalamin-binding protein [Metabacillus kandeliae]
MRLLSLCPSNTELAAFLGLEDQLAAVDDYSDWPESVASLPRLGPDLSINMDSVEKMNPDLVLASLSVPGMEKNVEELVKRQIPHIVFNPQSLDDIAEDLLTLSEACGLGETGRKFVSQYNEKITHYRSKAEQLQDKPRIYFEWWPNPIFTPGRINWLTEISALAGAVNIFEDVELASIQTDWKDVLSRNPDYIFLAWVGVSQKRMKPELVLKRQNSGSSAAVQRNQIHLLQEALYCRPSPRLLEGLEHLADLLHPGHFSS